MYVLTGRDEESQSDKVVVQVGWNNNWLHMISEDDVCLSIN